MSEKLTCEYCGKEYFYRQNGIAYADYSGTHACRCATAESKLERAENRIADLEEELDGFIEIAESWGLNKGSISLTRENVLHCINEGLADRDQLAMDLQIRDNAFDILQDQWNEERMRADRSDARWLNTVQRICAIAKASERAFVANRKAHPDYAYNALEADLAMVDAELSLLVDSFDEQEKE